ncbi:hypothetical protein FE257_004803 [Aspergillus nanangensis]|uniref:Signal transduction protein Syg1 n=1 Tax=Aspergillus nanangensis TaxID=2582783 RepID=A0AAD4GV20_ASPNN|nr:hypothetical protein FE257_004803 [Aspergillus nanangensis]
MKFAKELDQELVPEWRAKYLDYKARKKKLKAISRALHRSPRSPSLRRDQRGHFRSPSQKQDPKPLEAPYNPPTPGRSGGVLASTPGPRNERQPLRIPGSRFSANNVGSYGSIIATPPTHPAASDIASLELPDPAIDPKEPDYSPDPNVTPRDNVDQRAVPRTPSPVMSRQGSTRTMPPDISPTLKRSETDQKSKRNTVSGSSARRTSQLLKRVFSYQDGDPAEKREPVDQHSSEFERRQDEFFSFLDSELSKIETFYQSKEEEASERLKLLRDQLHIMRDKRIQDVLGRRKNRQQKSDANTSDGHSGLGGSRLKETIFGRRIGKNSRALAQLVNTPAALQGEDPNVVMNRRDFTRRPDDPAHAEVPYRSAKRKLKHALQEYYRGLELLKAYAYLNRKAFRKINKKYDKVVNARPAMRYMSDKVNKAWFVQSEVTEHLMAAAEDLYARYFERGNRKIAISKLRNTLNKSGDFSPNTFRAGLLLMAGVLFGVQALIYAAQHLDHDDPVVRTDTSYLLQWRLLLAGLYPVEFRDFFLGDMYCSQTYTMGNIALFFCLYAKHWTDAPQCNSSHSRLMGFFTTLPSIWRALQCIRRYVDTKNVFPHLLNFGKYMFGVLYYATLSMYRIDRVTRFQAPFITFALLNAVYTSVWDLAMDWSLGNPYAHHPLLREALAFRRVWVYYVAMVVDVIVRFNWIFYAIFAHDMQHSAVLSFVVSFSEICRRGVWTIFRVENEHCTNVLLFRASRDVPLPYEISAPHTEPEYPTINVQLQDQPGPPTQATAVDVEHATPPTPGASLRARGLSRVGTLVASAHAQDFQRKKRPDQISGPGMSPMVMDTPDDSSEDDDDDAAVVSRPYSDMDHVINEELPYRDSHSTSD